MTDYVARLERTGRQVVQVFDPNVLLPANSWWTVRRLDGTLWPHKYLTAEGAAKAFSLEEYKQQ